METAQANEASLSQAMAADFGQRFGEQSEILNGINKALTPTLEGGASAHGFSAEELAAKNSAAINETGAANANAQRAIAGQLASRGGDSGLQSGIDSQIRASVTSQQATNLANNELAITNADWATGRDEYHRALSGEGFLAEKVLNPEAYGQEATAANKENFAESDAINKANNQKWADIGGLVGSAVGMIPGIGSGIKALSGMFGKGNFSNDGDSAIGSGGS
jgi:hypothetical protein